MHFSLSPQLSTSVIRSQNIKKVSIKTKSGSLYTVLPPGTLITQASQNDSVYLYQTGEPMKPGNIILWWIQKIPGQKPDADSAFISLQY